MLVFRVTRYLLLCSLLTGCAYMPKSSFLQDRNKEYLAAKSIPPLRIPPGLSSNAITNEYPIPYREDSEASKNVNLTPPGLYS